MATKSAGGWAGRDHYSTTRARTTVRTLILLINGSRNACVRQRVDLYISLASARVCVCVTKEKTNPDISTKHTGPVLLRNSFVTMH